MSTQERTTQRGTGLCKRHLPALLLAIAGGIVGMPAQTALAQDNGDTITEINEHGFFETFFVKEEPIADILEVIAIKTQKNIVASKEVTGRVSANLYDVTLYQTLDAILNVNGFRWREEGDFIYVYSNAEWEQLQQAMKQRIVEVYKLNYLSASDAAEMVKPLLSRDHGEIITNGKAEKFPALGDIPVGGEDYALGATLVIYDFEENVAAIGELLGSLDTRPAQVLVEATILQTSLTEANAFGVDFSIIEDLDFSSFFNIGGPLGIPDALLSKGSSSGFPADNQATALSSTAGNTGGPATFKIGLIADEVAVFVRALDEVSDTTIVSNPKILTLNRQPARVHVGRRVGYLNTTATETSTTQTVEYLDTGTQLYFRPFVSDTGEIRMELKPTVSEAILREAADSGGNILTIPDEVNQTINTNINVRDGQTIVLGGLFREETTVARRQVPLLGDIPLVGAAFRGNDDDVKRSEVIFMITPTIVTDTMIANAADRAEDDVERYRAGSRQGLLPFSREKMTSAMNVEAERLARAGEYDKAMWQIDRSLSLRPVQPDVMRLRERLMGSREVWPSHSTFEFMLHDELTEQLREITPPATEPKEYFYNFQADIMNRPAHPVHPDNGDQVFHGDVPAFDLASINQADVQVENVPEVNVEAVEVAVAKPAAVKTASVKAAKATKAVKGTSLNKETSKVIASLKDLTPVQEKQYWNYVMQVMDTRAQIELFRSKFGRLPNLENGWDEMISNGFLAQAPVNPWISGSNTADVVVNGKPDSRAHDTYGWVFNSKTGDLWGAGFSSDDLPLLKSGIVMDDTDSTDGAEGSVELAGVETDHE